MNLLVSNKIVCSMGLFEGPGNEGEELHQMFAICDEIIKILPTWDFVFKNSNEKLDKRLIKIWMGFFSLGSLFDWRETLQFSLSKCFLTGVSSYLCNMLWK